MAITTSRPAAAISVAERKPRQDDPERLTFDKPADVATGSQFSHEVVPSSVPYAALALVANSR
jgi:hypothetical protein